MDNALASRDALNLSVGVSLTDEQVAALIHDIVWMEEQQVRGQRVPVPVLYLAQADHRLAHNGTLIQGNDVSLISGGDQRYQAAQLNSGRNLTLESGGAITFEGVTDRHQESHEKSKSDLAWTSAKGKGRTDETVRQTQMVAKGEMAIRAVDGLHIDVKQVDQETVSQAIDAMVKADPQLAWLKDAERRGDVDWRQVKELHDSFKYSHSGLGAGSQLVIAIVMAAVVGPAAMGAMTAAGAPAAVAAGTSAVAATAASNATISAVNNRGNLGSVFKDVTSSDAMKGYAISGITAGLTNAYFDELTGTQTDVASGKVGGAKLYTWKGVGQFAANQTLQNGTSYVVGKALGQEGSASDALKGALFNTIAAASFNAIGDYTGVGDGTPPKIVVHAMVGGLISWASGGDFKTGALAAGANEALVVHLNKLVGGNEQLLTASSQIVGLMTAASQEDADPEKLQQATWITKNATQYNFLGDHSAKQRDEAREQFRDEGGLQAARTLVSLEGADHRSDNLLKAYRQNPASLNADDLAELTAYLQVYTYEQAQKGGQRAAQQSLENLLNDDVPNYFPYAGRREDRFAWADEERGKQDGLFASLAWTRDKTPEEHLYNGTKGTLGIGQEQEGLANIGTPALYALSGPVGSGIRAMAATNGALQFGQGAKQAVEGDSWSAAGNMVFGALGMASLGVPRVTAGGTNTAVRPATVASDEVVLAPHQQTGRNLADDARPALVDTARVGDGVKVAATGSGPAKGFIEISDAYSSSKAVQGLNNTKPIDFIYDPISKRFIMGRNQFGHDGILNAGKIPSSDVIVGGGIWRENGVLRTYEWSGHYGMNWTPEIREQFKSFMSSHGVDVTHTAGIAR